MKCHSGSFYLRTSTLNFIKNNKKKNSNKIVHIYEVSLCIYSYSGSFYLRKSALNFYKNNKWNEEKILIKY